MITVTDRECYEMMEEVINDLYVENINMPTEKAVPRAVNVSVIRTALKDALGANDIYNKSDATTLFDTLHDAILHNLNYKKAAYNAAYNAYCVNTKEDEEAAYSAAYEVTYAFTNSKLTAEDTAANVVDTIISNVDIYSDGEIVDKDNEAIILEKGWYHLTKQDKALLLEYAPMFNTLVNPAALYKVMSGFVVLVAEYRYDKEWQRKSDVLHKQQRGRPSNEGKAYRENQFKKDIERLLDYIGHVDMALYSKGKEGMRSRLRHELRDAQKTPNDYILDRNKITISISKDPIEEYLVSLSLADNSQMIRDFKKKID